MTDVTPSVDLTIFPRVNYLKNFDARALRRDFNGRIYGIYGIVSIDSERYPEIDGSTCLNGETSFTFELGPNVTTTPTSVIDLRNDCGIATVIDLGLDDITFTIAITNAELTFNLRTLSSNYNVDWGDGSSDTNVTSTNVTHDYTSAGPGTYVIKINVNSGSFAPNFYASSTADQLITFSLNSNDIYGTNLYRAFRDCGNMTQYSQPFSATSNCTSFMNTWQYCNNLESFPLIDTSSGTSFLGCWYGARLLTSFPALNFSSATSLRNAWNSCFDLETFPSGVFDDTGTLASTAFDGAFYRCNLSAQSIENILTSIKKNVENGYSGASGTTYTLNLNGGTNAARTTWTTTAESAATYLEANNYTIYSN